MPVADTVKTAGWPAMMVWLAGCIAIVGATGAVVTVSVAGLLVTVLMLSLTATLNIVPLSEDAVTGVVYVEKVAPPIATPFFFH